MFISLHIFICVLKTLVDFIIFYKECCLKLLNSIIIFLFTIVNIKQTNVTNCFRTNHFVEKNRSNYFVKFEMFLQRQ